MVRINELKNKFSGSKLTLDSFWALSGNVIAKGLALVAGILVARFLGKEVYGEYGIIKGTLMSLSIFSTLGLGYTATKYIAEYKEKKSEYIPIIIKYSRNITLVLSSIMAVVLFFTSTYVSNVILEAPHLKTPLKLVSGWLVFNALTTTQIGILAGFGEFKGMARINMLVGFITFIFTVVFTYFWSLLGALCALLVGQILNWYLNRRLISSISPKNELKGKIKDVVFLKEILFFSLPVALQQGSYSLTTWLASLMLIKYTGYGELGLYTVAIQWGAIILFIPGVLYNVILSHLTGAKNDRYKFNKILKTTLFFNFIITFSSFIVVYLFSNNITSLYGSGFKGLESIITLTVFTVILTSLSDVYVQAYLSNGKNWLMFYLKLVKDFGILCLAYCLFISTINIRGAMVLILSKIIWSFIFLVLVVFIYEILIKSKEHE